MTSSINTTLDNMLSVNMLSDKAAERINESFSKGKNVEKDEKAEKAKKSESKIDDEDTAVSSDSDEAKEIETSSEESAYNKLVEFDYNKAETSFEIGDYIKRYTSAVSNYLAYMSENKVSLGESQLKDVLKNKFKIKIAKSAYNDVGMGEYYNLKKILNYSQSLNSNNGDTNIIKNLTNFKITV